MIISALITPLSLAVDPKRPEFKEHFVEPSSYNHETQQPEYSYGDVVGKPNTMSFTWNGTQTFDYNGQPKDADADND